MLAEVWKRVGVSADSQSWHLAGSSDSAAGPVCRARLVLGQRAFPRFQVQLSASGFLRCERRAFIFLKRALCLGRVSLFPWNVVVRCLRVRSETREDGGAEERCEKSRALL